MATLKVLVWNTLKQWRQHSGNTDVQQLFNQHDVIVLTETALKETNTSSAAMHGYQHYAYTRTTVTGASGGVSVYVRHGLHRFVTRLQPTLPEVGRARGAYRDPECVWLRISKQCLAIQQDILLCAAYLPPQQSDVDGREQVDRLHAALNSMLTPSDCAVIAGDLNAHIGQLPDTPDQDALEGLGTAVPQGLHAGMGREV